MMHKKQSIRNKYLAYRDSLSKSERLSKSMKIWENLKNEVSFQEADVILVYMDYRSEVMTTGLVEELLHPESKKRVFAPVVEGFTIVFYEIKSLEELHPGYQSIREPESRKENLFTKEISEENKCLVLVPGAVYDRQMGRLGYGKGFYDRFLTDFAGIPSAGLAFSCQIAPVDVPSEPQDKKVGMVVTEEEVIKG